MKKIVFLLMVFAVAACKSKNDKETTVEEISTDAQEIATESTPNDFNKLAISERDEEILLGAIDRQGLHREQFKSWFDENLQGHVLDSVTAENTKPLLEDVDIRIFMGTWCEDSQREIPALYKVLDYIDYNEENLYMVAVSRAKITPQEYEKDYHIEYVPTIIFIKDGNELGRFVEYAQETLEKDIFAIMSGTGYKHPYEE